MEETITLILTKPIHARIRTAYMRAYENLEDGVKDEVLIHHRVNNFEVLTCAKCKKELEISNQIFLINDNDSRVIAYCEECGIEKYNNFFVIEDSVKTEKISHRY